MSEVRNNQERSQFELDVDGHVARAEYRKQGEVIVFTHTVVPQALQGQGIGSRLIEGALAQVRTAGQKIDPQCSFVARYLAQHPEWQDLRA